MGFILSTNFKHSETNKTKIVMKRRKFMLSTLAIYPFTIFTNIKNMIRKRTEIGFKVNSGQARFGRHYKMKGVTLNVLDIKISGRDTDGDLSVFEQTGLSPNGGPPLHIHPFQDEWFYVINGKYLFQVGDEKYNLSKGDTIFLPRNIQHGFIQLTKKGKMIVSYLPAGKMEDFFKVTDEWTSVPTREEIAKVFEDHDMKIVGPQVALKR